MSTCPDILVIDDGELDAVVAQLRELGTEPTRLRGGAIPEQISPPRALFVATTRHAHHTADWPEESRPVCIGVVSEDSKLLRDRLRSGGYDFLVRLPVHPAALQMLLRRALYDGQERRDSARHVVGRPLDLILQETALEGILVEVSRSGARVLLARTAEVDASVELDLRRSVDDAFPVRVTGRVLRCVRKDTGDDRHPFSVSLVFQEISEPVGKKLDVFIQEISGEPIAGSVAQARPAATSVPGHPKNLPPPHRRRALPDSGDRRRTPRTPFSRPLTLQDGEKHQVVMGRDVSKGGMRIEPRSDLKEGDRVRVLLVGEPGGEPIQIRAEVIRDDLHQGLALRFQDLSSAEEDLLESFVTHLPAVESLREGEADSLGAVLSEIRKEDHVTL